MTIADLKGQLLARQATFQAELQARRQTVVLIEADLLKARREADTTHGALQATQSALADVELALQAAGTGVAAALPGGGRG